MKKVSLVFMLAISMALLGFNYSANAQATGHSYKTGIGVKVGYWGGGALDIKHFLNPSSALEGQLSFDRHWFTVTGLYEYHGAIDGAPGLLWYVGPGAHLGFYHDSYYHHDHHYDNGEAFFGLDGILGLDYKFNGAPIDISLDIQPNVSFPYGDLNIWGGVSIRFTF